ncbi:MULTISPECIES: hypothetical protein [Aerosakkonema]|uniref:hypothetical protein n=1 Tax=Aerosakkonema TaxID=1246629 RepID=UPI0035B83F7F
MTSSVKLEILQDSLFKIYLSMGICGQQTQPLMNICDRAIISVYFVTQINISHCG